MSKFEHYDILDVLRVIKSVWVALVLAPLVAAAIVGLWAFFSLKEPTDTFVVYSVLSFPVGSTDLSEIVSQTSRAATTPGEDGPNFFLKAEELPSRQGAQYRTVRIEVTGGQSVGGRAIVETVIDRVSEDVDAYNAEIEKHIAALLGQGDVLERFFAELDRQGIYDNSIETVSTIANSAASLVIAINDVKGRVVGLRALARGGVHLDTAIQGPEIKIDHRWLRFPVVAALGVLSATLLFAFIFDGIWGAARRRRSQV